ncbi:hypothetical protein ACFX2I_019765 [Malus domestica]
MTWNLRCARPVVESNCVSGFESEVPILYPFAFTVESKIDGSITKQKQIAWKVEIRSVLNTAASMNLEEDDGESGKRTWTMPHHHLHEMRETETLRASIPSTRR